MDNGFSLPRFSIEIDALWAKKVNYNLKQYLIPHKGAQNILIKD